MVALPSSSNAAKTPICRCPRSLPPNPTFDALRPTHAFRAPASGEFDGTAIILTNDLGVLPGGLHSFPRAMNQAGELVGYPSTMSTCSASNGIPMPPAQPLIPLTTAS